jgi:prepilin-type N-terminal cleavage/methylation domain-containing protein
MSTNDQNPNSSRDGVPDGSRCFRRHCRRAFSLIEIMVGVALISVIILGLLAMFYQVQRAFRAGTTQADILEGGRATMSLLVRDLQEMTASQFPFVTNCVIEPSGGLNYTTQKLPTGGVRNNHLQDILFLSRSGDKFVGTGYRVAYSSNGVGILYRMVTDDFRGTLPATNRLKWELISGQLAVLRPATSPSYHRVLDGVVGLTFTPYFTNGITYSNTFSGGTLVELEGRVIDYAGGQFQFIGDKIPSYVDVELAVVEQNILARFRARDADAAGQASALEYLDRQIGKTHLFRQRVAIRPAASEIGVIR